MSTLAKIVSERHLAARIDAAPRPLVMTNGVFDIIHRGHVDYLERAASLGRTLIVALNTDKSVRLLGKGDDRPINSEMDRAFVLAGLQSVDLVTFFSAKTPEELILRIRPDVYVKGGDYDIESLQETRLVRAMGGTSIALPFIDGYSTTSMLQRATKTRASGERLRQAAFLDRDGVINIDKGYVSSWSDFEFVPGAVEAMKMLRNSGYVLVVVTNQSGIARGVFDEDTYHRLTARYLEELRQYGVVVERVYHCPHHPLGVVKHLAIECQCRKPAPGMLWRAAEELGLSLENSILVGDKADDIRAAQAAGVGRAFSVKSSNPDSVANNDDSDGHYPNLLDCVKNILPSIVQESSR